MTTNNVDNVNHPSHYANGKHECIDMMEVTLGIQAVIEFCRCNIFKYRFRAEDKNGKEDYDKADWYYEKLCQLIEKQNKGVVKDK